ncbi:MAG: SBBP repeat-containing protein, partial [Pyrinomonadaceae bacterium]|nr:SBBP repeat-containing protein [Pyrinomonadaceae bacterium]
PGVHYLARGRGYSMMLADGRALVALQNDDRSAVLEMSIAGAHAGSAITAENELEGKVNYLTGSDPADWKTDIATFEKVRYREIYRGIDLIFYGNQQELEFDFIVRPDASPDTIALEFSGADDIELTEDGDLNISVAGRNLIQHKPIAYQELNGERVEVAANYSISQDSTARRKIIFEIGEYDRSQPLIIDPVLSYSTFLGGSGAGGLGGDTGRGIAVDSGGNAYVAGWTNSVTQFPLVGAFQSQIATNLRAAFVTKINSAGTAFVYSTYLSGALLDSNNGHTTGFDIAVDSAGKAYVVGVTQACNFPTTAGAYLPGNLPSGSGPGCVNGIAGFLTKFNAAGNGLEYSTFIASPTNFAFYGDGCCPEVRGVTVDSGGNAYVTGFTNQPTFPTTPGAFRAAPVAAAGFDVFVMKFNPAGSGLVYSTFLGTSNTQQADAFGRQGSESFSIALDAANNAVVSGHTTSTTLPIAGAAPQTSYAGFRDGFVTKLNSTGTGLIYSTYLGGSGRDGEPANVAVDSTGNAYVAITTQSRNFPLTPTAFHPFIGGNNNIGVVTKLNTSGGIVFSTVIGSGNSDVTATDVAVDAGGNAYLTGGGLIHSINSLFPSGRGFVSKFNASGTGLYFGSYLDGTDSGGTYIRSVALDGGGNAFVTGNTNVTNFPTSVGAPQTVNLGGGSFEGDLGDALISRISLTGTDCPAITINPQPLRPPVRGQNYNQQLTATGGTAPYAFSIFQNQLPSGLTLSATGLISGTPVGMPTSWTPTIRATDANGCIGVRPYLHKVFYGNRPLDFDGDLKADLAIFRPSNGTWYRFDSFRNISFQCTQFGANGDIPAPGDFDGDGILDMTVFRPSNGTWFRIESLTGNVSGFQFGTSGDIPVVGDYDGDSISDYALFRPSNGIWYILQSTGGFTYVQFGAAGDRPVVGDYDGDGRSDVCVFRPSTGQWFRIHSSNGQFVPFGFGANGDVPVRGDFNGGGQADLALFRPSNGTWYFTYTENGQFSAMQFGASGDVPVASDYDGDLKADIAVWRPSTGIWYIIRSNTGSFYSVQFGANSDIPIASQ